MPPKNHKRGTPTPRQIEICDYYNSLPEDCFRQIETARHFGIGAANVIKHLKGFERNKLLTMGYQVPELKELVKRGYTANDNNAADSRLKFLRLVTKEGVALSPDKLPTNPVPVNRVVSSDDDNIDERPEPRDVFIRDRQSYFTRYIHLPKKGTLSLLVTSAQDATAVHQLFWSNLQSYLAWLDARSEGAGAELIVSGFTYNKSLFGGNHEKTDPSFLSSSDLHELEEKDLRKLVFFDNAIEEHWSNDRIKLEDLLDVCAEVNTLPTATTPLTGMATYTHGRWGIFPHAKHQLESVARMEGKPYKANVTTGACTVPNYIAKKAGQKAEMHHTIGFVIVEAIPDGRFWVRTVSADPVTGAFRDLDRLVDEEGVHEDQTVATISYGDVHHEKLDPAVAKATWGYDLERGRSPKVWQRDALVDMLKPEHQFFHDVSDFSPRNHHNVQDPHFLAATYFRKEASVERELAKVGNFLKQTKRDGCQSVVVQSNHDNAFLKWLKTADVRQDPENAEIYHRSQAVIYRHIREHGEEPPIFEWTVKGLAPAKSIEDVMFIAEQDSYEVHGIEYSQHGHLGPNGSRGTASSLFKVAPKITKGHDHSPTIRDGLFSSGVCQLKMGYNKGPSSWAIAHTIGHHDGSRQILFYNHGDFFAR